MDLIITNHCYIWIFTVYIQIFDVSPLTLLETARTTVLCCSNKRIVGAINKQKGPNQKRQKKKFRNVRTSFLPCLKWLCRLRWTGRRPDGEKLGWVMVALHIYDLFIRLTTKHYPITTLLLLLFVTIPNARSSSLKDRLVQHMYVYIYIIVNEMVFILNRDTATSRMLQHQRPLWMQDITQCCCNRRKSSQPFINSLSN